MISLVKENDLRLTVPGQASICNGQSQTLEKLDSGKKFVKPNRAVEIVRVHITPDYLLLERSR